MIWFAGLVIVWPLLGEFAAGIGASATSWIPDSGIMEWPIIASYVIEGFAAFLLVIAVQRFFGAPRWAWLAVATAQGVPVILFFCALLGSSAGLHYHILEQFLFSRGGSGPLPLDQQFAEFFGWWIWGAVLPVLGAWLASTSAVEAGLAHEFGRPSETDGVDAPTK
jgi:hypothetical protein